jgi:uncharacterized protein YjeT (DUF2065 family)
MDLPQWITVTALSILLAEGCMLSLFPAQFRQMLNEVDPRWLQLAGLCEIVLAAGLLAILLIR